MARSTRLLKSAKFIFMALTAGMLVAPAVQAQDFPGGKPVHYIVPYPPGGSTSDRLGRLVATKLEALLKTSVLVENKAGGAGVVGTAVGASARADGYTLLQTDSGPLAVTPALQPVPYDPSKDFAVVAGLGRQVFTIAVDSKLPYQTFEELLAYGKANPNKLNFGAVSAISEFSYQLLNEATGLEMQVIPYAGAAPAAQALLSGEVGVIISSPLSLSSFIKAGQMRPLAMFAEKRSSLVPEVPTFDELGHKDLHVDVNMVLLAPAKTPEAALETLRAAAKSVVSDAEVISFMQDNGMDAFDPETKPEAVAEIFERDRKRWTDLAAAKK